MEKTNPQRETAPMVRARRIKQTIRIEERNHPPSSVFDITVTYPSDALPEWFAPLQPIVEDETFTSMTITLDEKVEYLIGIAPEAPDEEVSDMVVERDRRPALHAESEH